ncbi:PCYCGC motif-containing (lipo)protein, partial [Vibrio parahaemolyticus]
RLFCYCGCDETDDHNSLLDCFTSDHGVDCDICQKEVLLALAMNQKGASVADIQKKIDMTFEKEYPFKEPSPRLVKYRKVRLWSP